MDPPAIEGIVMSQTEISPPAIPPPPEPPAARERGRGPLWIVLGLLVVIAAGIAAFALVPDDAADARPIALSFTEGDEQTYEIHQVMDAQLSSPLFGDQALAMDVTQVIGWRVLSVDEEGTATIEVTVSEMSGTLNGDEIPSTPVPPVEIEIAKDGRVLSAGGFALGGAAETQGFGFPGMGQLTPILPDEGDAVSVGDTWDKEFSQDVPFGEGSIEYTASSTYARDETVDGRQAAVIQTQITVPLDFTLELSQLIETLGPEIAGATGVPAAGELEGARLGYAGRGAFEQTSFVDLDAQELLRSNSQGEFDISMTFEGIPGLGEDAASGTMDFSGTFSQDLELR